MSKVTLKVEIDEEVYKQIKSDSVYDNNNKVIISKSSSAYYALNAIINATPITESDDCVSKKAVLEVLHKYGKFIFVTDNPQYTDMVDEMTNLPSVLPGREHGEWCEQNDDYFDWYECSECGYGSEGEMQYSSEHDVRTKYCPNCGAEMR